jgi:hypothetical protein
MQSVTLAYACLHCEAPAGRHAWALSASMAERLSTSLPGSRQLASISVLPAPMSPHHHCACTNAEPSVLVQLATGPVLVAWQNASASAVIAFAVRRSAAAFECMLHMLSLRCICSSMRIRQQQIASQLCTRCIKTTFSQEQSPYYVNSCKLCTGQRVQPGVQRHGAGLRPGQRGAAAPGRLCGRLCRQRGQPLCRPGQRHGRRRADAAAAHRQRVRRPGTFKTLILAPDACSAAELGANLDVTGRQAACCAVVGCLACAAGGCCQSTGWVVACQSGRSTASAGSALPCSL